MGLLLLALGWVAVWTLIIWVCFRSAKGTNGSNY